MKKIYFFIGTTAELIKLAPVIKELKNRKATFKIISSNQNSLDFNEVKFITGGCKIDYVFKMKPFKRPKNIYLRFLVWIIKSIGNYLIYFKNEFKDDKNVLFIVHGDTVSSLIGAVVAKLCGVKLIHIESGLRSFDFFEPFPEEICRFVISYLADVHYSPNKWSMDNLKNAYGMKINTFGNTVGESVNAVLRIGYDRKSQLGIKKGQKYFILVIHRQEHTLFNNKETVKILDTVFKQINEKLRCVFIMHRLTKNYLKSHSLYSKINKNPNIILPDRLPYLSFIKLLNNAEFIASDGGTNQEEAYYLGKPCLILRHKTERIEGLGKNAILLGDENKKITTFMKTYTKYKNRKVKIKVSPSQIIVNNLLNI